MAIYYPALIQKYFWEPEGAPNAKVVVTPKGRKPYEVPGGVIHVIVCIFLPLQNILKAKRFQAQGYNGQFSGAGPLYNNAKASLPQYHRHKSRLNKEVYSLK